MEAGAAAAAQCRGTEMRQSIATQGTVRDQTASLKFDEKLSTETCVARLSSRGIVIDFLNWEKDSSI